MANATMRVLRLIWRRARRQHHELPEVADRECRFLSLRPGAPTSSRIGRRGGTGSKQIANPVRRDFYIWLALSGCRAGETMSMAVKNIDLKHGIAKYPITKTEAFEMPISDYMIELLRNRIAENGADCKWVFPSPSSATGHLAEEKLSKAEAKLFKQHWSPHTLRHSWITTADQKVKISDSHQRALTNHKPKRTKNGDAHAGYIHPDLDDLRHSQQAMTDYLLAQIKLKPRPTADNVVPLRSSN